jgi:hypothetical protein
MSAITIFMPCAAKALAWGDAAAAAGDECHFAREILHGAAPHSRCGFSMKPRQ